MAPISYIPKQSKELTNDEIKRLIKEKSLIKTRENRYKRTELQIHERIKKLTGAL